MALSLADLNNKIIKLQAQANEIRRKDRKLVIEQVRQAIALYDLDPADLFAAPGAKKGRGRPVAAGEAPVPRRGRPAGIKNRKPPAVKYRDDEGNTWTGRGIQPKWLKAHIESGRSIEDFAVGDA